MRLDQFIANTTPLSRKEARRAIHSGRVTVAGSPCKRAATHVDPLSRIELDGVLLALSGERYLMLNKPQGVVSATSDPLHATALSLIPADLRQGLHIVGRLDIDTTGLLLLTTDGQWSHRITSPRVECPKTYQVTLAEPISQTAIRELERGVNLHSEDKPTRPARVQQTGEMAIELTIYEGRYHQVKRMVAAVGNHVVALHRLRIGGITLDPILQPGEFRELTEGEVAL